MTVAGRTGGLKLTERLHFLMRNSSEMVLAMRNFHHVDDDMRECNMAKAPVKQVAPLPPQPNQGDFCTHSEVQKV